MRKVKKKDKCNSGRKYLQLTPQRIIALICKGLLKSTNKQTMGKIHEFTVDNTWSYKWHLSTWKMFKLILNYMQRKTKLKYKFWPIRHEISDFNIS